MQRLRKLSEKVKLKVSSMYLNLKVSLKKRLHTEEKVKYMKGSNKKILIVEDDTNFGSILKEYLTINDYDITLAKNGIVGFEKFKKDDFDSLLQNLIDDLASWVARQYYLL